MVGPSGAGPPPDWAVGTPPEDGPAESGPADSGPAWQGDVSAGVEAWLHTGSGLPADDDGSGAEADHEAVARKILLDQLTGQARSRCELADRLARKNVPDEVATRLLDRFEEVGLVDDEAFARSWIASRQPGKGLARRALAQELRRKGIDDDVARAALDEVDPDDEEAAARRLVRKKLRGLGGVDTDRATRRLVGMLARKGYPAGLSFSVVREEMAAVAGGDIGPEDPAEPPTDW